MLEQVEQDPLRSRLGERAVPIQQARDLLAGLGDSDGAERMQRLLEGIQLVATAAWKAEEDRPRFTHQVGFSNGAVWPDPATVAALQHLQDPAALHAISRLVTPGGRKAWARAVNVWPPRG